MKIMTTFLKGVPFVQNTGFSGYTLPTWLNVPTFPLSHYTDKESETDTINSP